MKPFGQKAIYIYYFQEIKDTFARMLKRGSVITKALTFLSNQGYSVPKLEYSEDTVLLTDLKAKCAGVMDDFRRNDINFDEFTYFIESDSKMFLFEFEQKTKEIHDTSEKDLKQFKSVFADTCAFFHKLLLFENACFDVFDEIKSITERFERTFDEELSTM